MLDLCEFDLWFVQLFVISVNFYGISDPSFNHKFDETYIVKKVLFTMLQIYINNVIKFWPNPFKSSFYGSCTATVVCCLIFKRFRAKDVEISSIHIFSQNNQNTVVSELRGGRSERCNCPPQICIGLFVEISAWFSHMQL